MAERKTISDFTILTGLAFGVFLGNHAVQEAIFISWGRVYRDAPWGLLLVFYSWLCMASLPFLLFSHLPLKKKSHFFVIILVSMLLGYFCIIKRHNVEITYLSLAACIYFPLHFLYTPCKNFISKKQAQKAGH